MPDDLYNSLIDGYKKERDELSPRLELLRDQITELTKETDNATQFVSLVEQYVDITKLDRDLLHRLIDHIEIGESYKENSVRYQVINIYYRFVGKIEMYPFEN